MRQKYLEVVDEVELLKEDLDAVSRDLDHLSNGKGAEIHATIDKFGKTANLKLHDAPLTEGDEPEQPPQYTGLKFFRKPTVRQVPLLLSSVLMVVLLQRCFVSKHRVGRDPAPGVVHRFVLCWDYRH
jgi:hypothetical protein